MTLEDMKIKVIKKYGFTSEEARHFFSLVKVYNYTSSKFYRELMNYYNSIIY